MYKVKEITQNIWKHKQGYFPAKKSC